MSGHPGAARRFLLLADGQFNPLDAKTAVGALRYIPEQVAAVLDRSHAGGTVADTLGIACDLPVVASVQEGVRCGANALLVGIAPVGGVLPTAWRGWILDGLRLGLDAWSGLHTFLSEDPEFEAAAAGSGARLHDLRRVPEQLPVAAARVAAQPVPVVLTVGTDCNVGKMTTALEVHRTLRSRGVRAAFLATGQTGILVAGAGMAVDRLISDFLAGGAEQMVLEAAPGSDVILVEGQGSLLHPGYSAVTLGLLHGSAPTAMVLCHQAGREQLRHGGRSLPSLAEVVGIYENAASWVRPARVLGGALNTMHLREPEARRALDVASGETGLPFVDPVRFGAGPLADCIEAHIQERAHAR